VLQLHRVSAGTAVWSARALRYETRARGEPPAGRRLERPM